jgi:hypothetical protein
VALSKYVTTPLVRVCDADAEERLVEVDVQRVVVELGPLVEFERARRLLADA